MLPDGAARALSGTPRPGNKGRPRRLISCHCACDIPIHAPMLDVFGLFLRVFDVSFCNYPDTRMLDKLLRSLAKPTFAGESRLRHCHGSVSETSHLGRPDETHGRTTLHPLSSAIGVILCNC